jgi:hypothetical protein
VFFSHSRDARGLGQSQDDECLAPVGLEDEEVVLGEPAIELGETVAARLYLDAAIDSEKRNADIATEAAASGAGQRHALSAEGVGLEQRDDGALNPITFISGTPATTLAARGRVRIHCRGQWDHLCGLAGRAPVPGRLAFRGGWSLRPLRERPASARPRRQ